LQHYCTLSHRMGSLRKTKSVKVILGLFEQTEEALSVVDLIEGLEKVMNKTTVYRILDRLEAVGILHSFVGKNGRKWYAKCKDCLPADPVYTHPHFQCSACGKVECVPFEIMIPSLTSYKVESADFLLIGECKECNSQ